MKERGLLERSTYALPRQNPDHFPYSYHMTSLQRSIGVIAALVIVLGGIWIVYAGRPVMRTEQYTSSVSGAPASPTSTSSSTAGTTTPTEGSGTSYTMADIALHASENDCWSAVNGSVYDLTTWISRHPGGARPIVGMCGKDGSSAFERQHGSARRPQAALILLKIGTLR